MKSFSVSNAATASAPNIQQYRGENLDRKICGMMYARTGTRPENRTGDGRVGKTKQEKLTEAGDVRPRSFLCYNIYMYLEDPCIP